MTIPYIDALGVVNLPLIHKVPTFTLCLDRKRRKQRVMKDYISFIWIPIGERREIEGRE